MELWDHQLEALAQLKNGSVLVGGTGSGKSLTSLAYYKKVLGESKRSPNALYIVTTAKKRDDGDWVREAQKLGITNLHVDSWNNIKKYVGVKGAFFIFDEQRVVGYGVWTRSFIKITRRNNWILLSATPADTWMDLIPVFIANGFYRNKTDFVRRHVIFAPYVLYPKVVGYREEVLLERLKNRVFVVMEDQRHTKRHVIQIPVDYNDWLVQDILKREWNPYTNKPVDTLAEAVFAIRRVVNSHPSRIMRLMEIQELAKRLIIFYNYNFELEIMKDWFQFICPVAEYNGKAHQPVPNSESWVYLVQFNSGSEAWETFETNHIAYYSLNYSYRTREQSRGRIDRHNTPFTDLYYYELVSDSIIDKAILKAIGSKKRFNIRMLDLTEPRGSQTV